MRIGVLEWDFTGVQFGYWVSLGRSGRTDQKGGKTYEAVRCVCGTEAERSVYGLVADKTRSCGCKKGDLVSAGMVRHGHCVTKGPHKNQAGSSTYRSWHAARRRCSDASDKRWHRYGGRGISVCERWASFDNFLQDMGEKPTPKHQLDRINNDLGYFPDNCRWVLNIQNCNNTSKCRKIAAFGRTLTISEWAREIGCNPETIRARLDRGWPPEKAVSEPIDKKFHSKKRNAAHGH